jgi:diadenosine tetraphosphate (Ap4A) HIT family hydrolase
MSAQRNFSNVTCFLCAATAGTEDIRWHDRPLWLDPRAGVVMAGLGGFTPGYVLIAPIAHQQNLCSSPEPLRDRFLSFLFETISYLEMRLGDLTFWEHGAPANSAIRRSACIDHAHLHVIPGTLALPEPPNSTHFPSIYDAIRSSPRAMASNGYLLVGWSSTSTAIGSDVRVSQYYRREWARITGRPDEWDYLLAEDANVTAETIQLLAPHARGADL